MEDQTIVKENNEQVLLPSQENGNSQEKEVDNTDKKDNILETENQQSPELLESKRILRSSSNTPTKFRKSTDKRENEEAPVENGNSEKTEYDGENDIIENGTDTKIAICEEKTELSDKNDEKEENSLDFAENDMDPLVLNDEPCPELEFDELSDKTSDKNSDRESLNLSPIVTRCKTRRSQVRNIPTPKTPKLDDDKDGKSSSSTPVADDLKSLTDKSASSENWSTKVQVGNDSMRCDSFNEGGSDFLTSLRSNSSTSERFITSRKSIRDNIRKQSLKNSMKVNKSFGFFSSESLERAPSVKRKNRSLTPEDVKRFKESPGFISLITSPINNIKNRFTISKPNITSTPKLTAYKDQKNHLGGDFFDQMEVAIEAREPENKWCSIM